MAYGQTDRQSKLKFVSAVSRIQDEVYMQTQAHGGRYKFGK